MCLLTHERELELRDERGLAVSKVLHISEMWGTEGKKLANKTKPHNTECLWLDQTLQCVSFPTDLQKKKQDQQTSSSRR